MAKYFLPNNIQLRKSTTPWASTPLPKTPPVATGRTAVPCTLVTPLLSSINGFVVGHMTAIIVTNLEDALRQEIKNTIDACSHRQSALWIRPSLHQEKMQGRTKVWPSLCLMPLIIQPVLLTMAKFPWTTGIHYCYICLLFKEWEKKNVKDLLRITEQLKLLTSGLEKHLQLQMHFYVKI